MDLGKFAPGTGYKWAGLFSTGIYRWSSWHDQIGSYPCETYLRDSGLVDRIGREPSHHPCAGAGANEKTIGIGAFSPRVSANIERTNVSGRKRENTGGFHHPFPCLSSHYPWSEQRCGWLQRIVVPCSIFQDIIAEVVPAGRWIRQLGRLRLDAHRTDNKQCTKDVGAATTVRLQGM